MSNGMHRSRIVESYVEQGDLKWPKPLLLTAPCMGGFAMLVFC
jgi:hypothetical protein